jgi:hypothetical protein
MRVKHTTTLPRPPRPVPRQMTVMKRPSFGTGWRYYAGDLPQKNIRIFFREGLDKFWVICPTG